MSLLPVLLSDTNPEGQKGAHDAALASRVLMAICFVLLEYSTVCRHGLTGQSHAGSMHQPCRLLGKVKEGSGAFVVCHLSQGPQQWPVVGGPPAIFVHA